MINVGVTGSNGFIGWHLCRTLELHSNKFKLIEFDRVWFNECNQLDNFVSKCDILVHLAGLNRHNNESTIYNINIALAESLVESFKRVGFIGQLIFSSSIQEDRNTLFGNSKKVAREIFANWNLNLIYINDLIKNIIGLFNTEANEKLIFEYTDKLKVSEILNLLINFKIKYLLEGQIPNFNNQFELNLFNTFRSYINLKNYFPIKYINNIDERGNFVEIIRFETGGQVSFSATENAVTRGNHFHIRKIERFSVIKGEALIQLRKIGSTEVIDYHLSGKEPAYIDIPIWYTHNIKNIGEDTLYTIFWINEFYDESNPDTYFEIV